MVAFLLTRTVEQTAEQVALKQRRARRSWFTKSFDRGVQTLDEATESARSMAASLERKGLLLRAPTNR